MTNTGSITAVLKLNTEQFDGQIAKTREALTAFRNSMTKIGDNSSKITGGIQTLTSSLSSLIPVLSKFSNLVNQTKSFNQFTKGLLNMSEAVANLSNVTNTSQVGMIRIKEIMNAWSESARGLTVNLRTLKTEETAQQKSANMVARMYKEAQASLNQLYIYTNRYSAEMLKMGQTEAQERYQTQMLRKEWGLSGQQLVEVRAKLQQMEGAIVKFGNATVITSADLEKMAMAEKQVSASSTQASASLDKSSASANRSASSMNRASTQASRLGRAFSSLRMIGTMVGSMLAYNFAHHLAQATNETIQSKSEMEGYFKMLRFGQSDVNRFNEALDKTVQRFQRVNKYSLGETISSIGVEFNLTTDEMIKAMDVTSMITSEYLRAGRNANEASLAVKDILQGQFQRLSRETGVKQKNLEEAGWSGDTNDVQGLLDALRKVGEDRNWDTFATKANSLNDIVTILQNRFGEWSADMVNVVQPSIVSAFNSIMSFAQGLAESLGGLWKWLNGGSWGAIASQIGLVSGAILTLMPMLTAWRSKSSLLAMSNLSLTQSLTALVFGINAETLATNTSSSAIGMKLLGLEAEEVAEYGVGKAIAAKILGLEAESITTAEVTAVNGTFVGSLYAMITGEALAEAETLSLSGALAILTGTFLASPIGWFTLAILGLASAFYVLTGGLDSSWEKMKQFNETMKDTGTAQKEADQWLNQVKEDTDGTGKKFDEASDSVELFKQRLQSASYWYQHSNTAFEGMGLEMETSSKDILKDYGVSKEQAEEWSGNLDILNFGKDKYYKAEQVLNKQIKGENSNYAKDLDDYLASVKKNGGDLEEAYDKMTGNYANLAEHSYIANTSDDWWERSWNQLYAGMDQFWIDWDKFWADPQWGDALDGFSRLLNPVIEGMGFDSLGTKLTDWIGGIGKFFEGKSLMDLLGLDENKDYIGDFFKWISDSITNGLGDIGNWLSALPDPMEGLAQWLADSLGGIEEQLRKDWDAFWSFDWLTDFFSGSGDGGDGGSPSPLAKKIDVSSLIQGLFNLGDGIDFSWAWEFVNNHIITPITNTIQTFLADPVAFIGNMGFTITGMLDGIFGTDIFSQIWAWTNNSIITPFGTAIYNGIMAIPILGDVLQMLGFTDEAQGTASMKGDMLARKFGATLQEVIGQIPILGDVLRLLGLIPQAEPTASANGNTVGKGISDGLKKGVGDLANWVVQEFKDIADGIKGQAENLYNSAKGVGEDIWNGVNSVLQRHSPGFIHDEVMAEFGTDIPNAISSSGSTAFSTAQSYAQNMYAGMNSVSNTGFGLGGVVDEYQTDAQMVAQSSQMMGSDTTNAFNTMQTQVNATTTQMQGNVTSTYSAMQTKQSSALNSMKAQNLQAYNDMYLKSNQSLLQMRDSTSNITHQMTNAWVHMKDQIVASANKLKSDSTAHFNTLSATIGSFYRKIQNPSNWGAGSPNYPSRARRPSRGRTALNTIRSSKRGAGVNPYTNPTKLMSLRELMGMVDSNEKVSLEDFLAMFQGGFGWNDWSPRHYSHIKSTSDNWNMKAPMILGKYQAGSGFRVGDFEGGRPTIGFGDYVATAEAIFGSIPYSFYYNSEKWGSWDNAIKHGEANCSDGADALIALAHTMNPNWSTEKVHTTLKGGVGHFYAVINGKVMDTTAFQNRGSWGHLGAGIPTRRYGSSGSGMPQPSKTVNVNVEISGTVYGVEDLDDKIQESVRKGLQEEFNDPYSIAI